MVGPSQHIKTAVVDVWRGRVSADVCVGEACPFLDFQGSVQLLDSSHVRERDKALLRSIWVRGVWNGFLLGDVCGEIVHVVFCGVLTAMDIFWNCMYPPLVKFRENPESHGLTCMDKSHWPRCLVAFIVWSSWERSLVWIMGTRCSAICLMVPWVLALLMCSLTWDVLEDFDAEGAAGRLPANPNIWSDGSLLLDKVSGASSAGSGMYAHLLASAWGRRKWESISNSYKLLSVLDLSLVGASAQFMVPCRKCSGLSCGGISWHFRHWMLYMLVLTM